VHDELMFKPTPEAGKANGSVIAKRDDPESRANNENESMRGAMALGSRPLNIGDF
jgi:hypothetical protein